jgi:hypothetical protein
MEYIEDVLFDFEKMLNEQEGWIIYNLVTKYLEKRPGNNPVSEIMTWVTDSDPRKTMENIDFIKVEIDNLIKDMNELAEYQKECERAASAEYYTSRGCV